MTEEPKHEIKMPVLAIPDSVTGHPAWCRLNKQIDWHEKVSKEYWRHYIFWRILSIALAACIPIIIILPDCYSKIVAIFLSIAVSVSNAILYHKRLAFLWTTYRITAEELKRAKHLFLSIAGEYRNKPESERLIILAERIEEILSYERNIWYAETIRIVKNKEVSNSDKSDGS